jgi:ABC-type antimicrobial peptide transport system permease subunit
MFYRPAELSSRIFVAVVHSRSNEAATRLRTVATATDPRIRLSGVMTIDQKLEAQAQSMSLIMTPLGIVAAVILLLAAAGIHSLISFTLANRKREIGIRTALGAAPSRIVTSMLSPTFLKVGVGIVLGSIPGIAFVWEGLDFGISFQIVVVAAVSVALFIFAAAMISCIWPVRRALKIQPTEALRMI